MQTMNKASKFHVPRSIVFAIGLCISALSATAQDAVNRSVLFKAQVSAAEQAEIAARIDGWLTKINFTAGADGKEGRLAVRVRSRNRI